MTDVSAPPTGGDLPLRGITVLITGAARETGRNAARVLSALGANLHLSDNNETALIDAARTFHENAQGGIKLHVADVGERVDVEALAMDCEDADVLLHLAGDFPDKGADDLESNEAEKRAWNRRVFGAENLTAEMDPETTGKKRILFLLSLFPKTDAVRPRMADAALAALAEQLNAAGGAITAEAKNFDDADAIAARICVWAEPSPDQAGG